MSVFDNFNDWAASRSSGELAGNVNDAPLAGIDTDQYNYASFIYPLDLGAPGAGKDHYMVFHINETSNTQFVTAGGTPNTPPTVTGNQINDSNSQAGATQTTYDPSTSPIRRVATTIVLYIPNDITVNYAADWQVKDLGMSKDLVGFAKGEQSWKDLAASMGASLAQNLGNKTNSFTNLSLSDAILLDQRLVINNHSEVIFNGIGFRDFTFNFRFTAESEDEALNIDNIIRAFKFYSAPEILQGAAGRFWIYPAEFDIQYYSNGQENEFLNKISTCALTNMSVNATAAGHWAAHRPHSKLNGSPSVCTDISLTFRELELMTKKRIISGYSFLPIWIILPFIHPVIIWLHEFFILLSNTKPMLSYILSWLLTWILTFVISLPILSTIKNMLGLQLIQNIDGQNINVLQEQEKGMHYTKQFVNMVLKIFHLK